MKVHVVVMELESDHVLSRLASYLTNRTGWTIGTTPRSDVQLNYFFPYLILSQHFSHWHETPIAAYFSHYDPNNSKGVLWDKAAEKTDYAIVTAPQYAARLKRHNLDAVLVHAPVDMQFVPAVNRPAHKRPVIGVSGMTYGDGRKGEDLVRKLAEDLPQLEWRAAGRGWTIPTTRYAWKDMVAFYQDLDVYVCTSRIEGVPMPPLEALACGIPVVIPKGVGLLDTLPDMPGITRYEPGDYAGLKSAVQIAVHTPPPATLPITVNDYTPRRWLSDHLQAFENWFNPRPETEPLPPWNDHNAGVVYVAYGSPARACAKDAIASWRQHMSLPVAVISDQTLGCEDVFCLYPDADIGGRSAKLKTYDLVPAHWRYVLYLDADTELIAPIGFLFDLLADGWELVITKNPGKYHLWSRATRPDNAAELAYTAEVMGSTELIQMNGGVFGYRRCPQVQAFMSEWLIEWGRYGTRDQGALARALWKHPLCTYLLGNQWNTVVSRDETGRPVKRYDEPSISAGILHFPMTARRWSGPVPGRLDSEAAWRLVKQ
jgi:hypothetical protein